MHSKAIQQKQVISVFNDALRNGEFTPFYQPKVNTKTNTLVGAEALARWIRDGNLISPGDFIPVLEGDYRICELDFYMLEQVCKDLRRWIDEGMEPVCISTNFSRRNLSDPDFSKRITELISCYDIPKQYIEVELTETFSAEENKLLGRFINDMHDVGILIAIDDFGTGYSSLNLLREIPADLLKLDKSFIDGHTGAKRDSVVVSNIAKMANELNMGIIAEGVERREQVEFLQSVNIDMAQGYLYDKPLTKADFEKRLKDKIYKSE
jgi:EAL domain-containing protein (putative c-di-GMP-specific phosphodiesterase class I)